MAFIICLSKQEDTVSIEDAKKTAKNADIQPGLFNKGIANLDTWLKENGF